MTHFKAFKLKNGDLVGAKTNNDLKTSDILKSEIITVSDPICFNSFKFMDNEGELVETISMAPLIPIGMEDEFELATSHVFSVATMSPAAAERYESFVEHLKQVREEDEQEQAQQELDIDDVVETVTPKNFH